MSTPRNNPLTLARLLRLLACGAQFRDNPHAVILTAAATELEHFTAEYPPAVRVVEALDECLPLLGWANLTDVELLAEARAGNQTAPRILRARAALAATKVPS